MPTAKPSKGSGYRPPRRDLVDSFNRSLGIYGNFWDPKSRSSKKGYYPPDKTFQLRGPGRNKMDLR